MKLLRLLERSLEDERVRTRLPAGGLDPNSRFGLHLFVLGAGLACRGSLPENDAAPLGALIETALAVLGTDADRAHRFAAALNDYRQDPKHVAMIAAGQAAMSGFLAGNALDASGLRAALADWQAGDHKSASPPERGDVAIMFTDMVSSVETMMRLVEAHDLCAVASTDEIAVSDAATRQPGCARFALSAPHTVALKGFKERQPIRMLFWHESSPASALENAA